MEEQQPDFPVVNMPRMGRRNAITPSEQKLLPDDVGAFSPLHLLHRSSLAEVQSTNDPQNMLAMNDYNEKLQQFIKHEYSNKNGSLAKQNTKQTSKIKQAMAHNILPPNIVAEKIAAAEKAFENAEKPNPVIPWKKQDHALSSIGEERRKIFASFNKTSIEPPETPQMSEAKMRRLMNKSKGKKRKDKDAYRSLDSEESFEISNPKQPKNVKSPYSGVMPKVNTRWDKNAEANASWRQQQQLVQEQFKAAKQAAKIIGNAARVSGSRRPQSKRVSRSISRTKTTVVKKSTPGVKEKSGNKKDVTVELLKPKHVGNENQNDTNEPSPPKLVTNFPAAERVKDLSTKLPLTIGPRFNPRKAMGMGITTGVQNRAELIGNTTTRLYGALPPYQKLKHDAQMQLQQQHPVHHLQGTGTAGTYKSTFFNLHKINNAGIVNNNKVQANIGEGLVVIRHPNPGGVGGVLSVETKKALPFTTIQPPPSPFMTSVISIPSQLNEIPVNGELQMPPIQATTSGNDNKSEKSAKKGPAIKAKAKRESGNRYTYYRSNNSNKVPPNPARFIPTTNKTRGGKEISKKGEVPSPKLTAGAAKFTVVPTLGPAPNKYNNIYIGPYSGSESEGELRANKKAH